MLVLNRKLNETLLIGPDIRVTVVRIGPNSVQLGITAPGDVNIVREELLIELPLPGLDGAIDATTIPL